MCPSEEEARKKIYNVSGERYFGFGCEIDEETSNKLKSLQLYVPSKVRANLFLLPVVGSVSKYICLILLRCRDSRCSLRAP